MVDLFGLHGAHNADVVGDAPDVGQQRGHVLAALPVVPERVPGAEDAQLLALELCDLLPLRERLGHRLAVPLRQFRLVVQEFEMRRTARHAQEDDSFDPARPVRESPDSRLHAEQTRLQQRSEGD